MVYVKKECSLCALRIDEKLVKSMKKSTYGSLHGFCRSCRKTLRRLQKKFGGKVCRKCETDKPFGDFPAHRKTYDGFDSWCKLCRRSYSHEVKQTLDTHIRAILARIKEDRRKKPYDVDLGYLVGLWQSQDGLCAISGEKMSHRRTPRKHNQYNGSLDRIDSSLGYVKGNVQFVCWTVNRMKGEGTKEELIEWAKKIIRKWDC